MLCDRGDESMHQGKLPRITVSTIVNAPLETVWKHWTEPAHIEKWNYASDEWHCPHAENDLRVGGKFSYTMAAKDGSAQFDFYGTYDHVIENEEIVYTIADGRKVYISFMDDEAGTEVIETFDPEGQNTPELQQQGWQAILNNFKSHTENSL